MHSWRAEWQIYLLLFLILICMINCPLRSFASFNHNKNISERFYIAKLNKKSASFPQSISLLVIVPNIWTFQGFRGFISCLCNILFFFILRRHERILLGKLSLLFLLRAVFTKPCSAYHLWYPHFLWVACGYVYQMRILDFQCFKVASHHVVLQTEMHRARNSNLP